MVKKFENYTRFEWGVEVGVVTIFRLRLFAPHEFDMIFMKKHFNIEWPYFTHFLHWKH